MRIGIKTVPVFIKRCGETKVMDEGLCEKWKREEGRERILLAFEDGFSREGRFSNLIIETGTGFWLWRFFVPSPGYKRAEERLYALLPNGPR
jgi:hypothetical protein